MSSEETNPDVNDLLDALKAKGDIKVKATSNQNEEFTLDKDDIEAFILIRGSLNLNIAFRFKCV